MLAQARLVYETRLDVLVKASARWRRPGGPRVVLVGVGPAYRDLVAQATVARAPVTFAGDRHTGGPPGGRVAADGPAAAEGLADDRAGLEDLLAAASLAVVTDVRARPDFALRAVRAGVPLIVPQGGVVAQLLGGETGAVGAGSGVATVPAGDVEALDAAVQALLDEPTARADLVAAARERVAAWPDAAGAADALAGVYERVARAAAAPVQGAVDAPADTPGGLG